MQWPPASATGESLRDSGESSASKGLTSHAGSVKDRVRRIERGESGVGPSDSEEFDVCRSFEEEEELAKNPLETSGESSTTQPDDLTAVSEVETRARLHTHTHAHARTRTLTLRA